MMACCHGREGKEPSEKGTSISVRGSLAGLNPLGSSSLRRLFRLRRGVLRFQREPSSHRGGLDGRRGRGSLEGGPGQRRGRFFVATQGGQVKAPTASRVRLVGSPDVRRARIARESPRAAGGGRLHPRDGRRRRQARWTASPASRQPSCHRATASPSPVVASRSSRRRRAASCGPRWTPGPSPRRRSRRTRGPSERPTEPCAPRPRLRKRSSVPATPVRYKPRRRGLGRADPRGHDGPPFLLSTESPETSADVAPRRGRPARPRCSSACLVREPRGRPLRPDRNNGIWPGASPFHRVRCPVRSCSAMPCRGLPRSSSRGDVPIGFARGGPASARADYKVPGEARTPPLLVEDRVYLGILERAHSVVSLHLGAADATAPEVHYPAHLSRGASQMFMRNPIAVLALATPFALVAAAGGGQSTETASTTATTLGAGQGASPPRAAAASGTGSIQRQGYLCRDGAGSGQDQDQRRPEVRRDAQGRARAPHRRAEGRRPRNTLVYVTNAPRRRDRAHRRSAARPGRLHVQPSMLPSCGQAIKIRNSDDPLHNIHPRPTKKTPSSTSASRARAWRRPRPSKERS